MLDGHLVVDPLVWEVLLYGLAIIAGIAFIYFVRIYIAYKMAKNRQRDPLPWVLLSLFISPVLTWIVLLIIGNESQHPDLERMVNKAMTDLPPTDYGKEK